MQGSWISTKVWVSGRTDLEATWRTWSLMKVNHCVPFPPWLKESLLSIV